MSPRRTRRGTKADGANDTLSETISKTSNENSMLKSPRKTRLRTQKTNYQESDLDQSLDANKSKRNNEATPPATARKSRKKALSETVVNDSPSILDTTGSTKKRAARRRKVAENSTIALESTTVVDSPILEESKLEKSRVTRGRGRGAKKDKSEEDENKNEKVADDISKIENDEEADVSTSKESAEGEKAPTRNTRVRVATPVTPYSALRKRGRANVSKIQDFTPESSPIIIHLSPHRTTKTPRKSPMNLGSPKSHAEKSFGLPKTPRKLPVVEESPAPSEKSTSNTPDKLPKIADPFSSKIGESADKEEDSSRINATIDSPEKSLNNTINSETKQRKRTPKIKSPNKRLSNEVPTRKFSKSPRIVLRTPKAKSSKGKSPRVTSSKAKISPVKKVSIGSPQKSPKTLNKSPSPKKSPKKDVNNRSTSMKKSTSPRKLIKASSEKDVCASSPILCLEKLSSSLLGTLSAGKTTRSRSSNAPLNDSSVTEPEGASSGQKNFLPALKSPRGSKTAAAKLRTSISDSGTPLTPSISPRNASNRSIGKSSAISPKENTPILANRGKINGHEGASKMSSSTPRDRIRKSLNISRSLGIITPVASINTSLIESPASSSSIIHGARASRSSQNKNFSNSLITEDDDSFSPEDPPPNEDSRLNETFEIVKKEIPVAVEEDEEESKAKDGTYELLEPKTPVLRRQAGKRSHSEAEASLEDRASKRTCRVRFASPRPRESVDGSATERGSVASRVATPGQNSRDRQKRVNFSEAKSDNSKRRSLSMTNISLPKTPVTAAKRRSNSVSGSTVKSASRTAQNASVNRLSKPKITFSATNKAEVKTLSAKKAPNFAQIHERKFAKMESLVDAKKRVEMRHVAINSNIPTSMSKVNTNARSKGKEAPKTNAAGIAVSGGYNRYGFKLRKNDAINLVSNRQPKNTRGSFVFAFFAFCTFVMLEYLKCLKTSVHCMSMESSRSDEQDGMYSFGSRSLGMSKKVSEKKQMENRLLLKGVRTNRRFELIMKARNGNKK